MDRVFSARIDESAVGCIHRLARQLHSTKKKVLERAIELFAIQIEREQKTDVLEQSFGAWRREESADKIAEVSRVAFRQSMEKFNR